MMQPKIHPKVVLIDECLAEILVTEFSVPGTAVLHQRLMDEAASGSYDFGFKWSGLTNGELTEKAIEHLRADCVITGDGGFYEELPTPLPVPIIYVKKYNERNELDRHRGIISGKVIPQIREGLERGVYRATLAGIRRIRDEWGNEV